MEFKDKLKVLRQGRHISQQQLADTIFVSRSAVAKWENGLGIPSESSYNALLDFFGIVSEELPLNNEVEEISVTKNKKIHTLTAVVIAISIVFVLVLAVIIISSILVPENKLQSYDWEKVDALLAEIGKENNSYWPDGSLGNQGEAIEIYYNKDIEAETFIKLKKIYRTNSDDYYQLFFEKHFYNLVEGKIISVGYACSFHYQGDVVYNLELADVNYFIGEVESVDTFIQCTTYQVNNKKFENGKFLSCILEPISTFGDEFYDPDFHLPDGNQKHIEELMAFGFEKTTEFFEIYDLPTPY